MRIRIAVLRCLLIYLSWYNLVSNNSYEFVIMSEYEEKYRDALRKCGMRYSDMLMQYIDEINYWGNAHTTDAQTTNLGMFIIEFLKSVDSLPLMKLNRWLGYIQGSLIQWKITTVEAERDWTRPLFKPLDFGEEYGN